MVTWTVPEGFGQASPQQPFERGNPPGSQTDGARRAMGEYWLALALLLAFTMFFISRKSARR
jgi:hypothetical protein